MKHESHDASVPRLAASMPEAAASAGVSRSKFYELLAAGKGPPTFTLGRRRLVRVQALGDWLARREAEERDG